MKQYKIYQKILICAAPFLIAAVLYFAAVIIVEHFTLPPCFTYSILGIYCPGCGMTRSVTALLHGDILLSLRQNLLVVMGIIIAVLFYAEYAIRAFGKNIRFPIHNVKLIYAFLIFLAVYSVARNFIPQIAPV